MAQPLAAPVAVQAPLVDPTAVTLQGQITAAIQTALSTANLAAVGHLAAIPNIVIQNNVQPNMIQNQNANTTAANANRATNLAQAKTIVEIKDEAEITVVKEEKKVKEEKVKAEKPLLIDLAPEEAEDAIKEEDGEEVKVEKIRISLLSDDEK